MSRDQLAKVRDRILQLVAVALLALSIYTLGKDVHTGDMVHLTSAIVAGAEFGVALWLLDNKKAKALIDFAIDRVQRVRGKA